MNEEKYMDKLLEQYKEILAQPTQTEKRAKLVEQALNYKRKNKEVPPLANNLNELLDYISVVTEEWRKGGANTVEEDMLNELNNNIPPGREERDESVRLLELPLTQQLNQMVDKIPLNQIPQVLDIIKEDNIKIWDMDQAIVLMRKIRQKLEDRLRANN